MAAYLPSFVQAPDFMDETEAQGGKSSLPRVPQGVGWQRLASKSKACSIIPALLEPSCVPGTK